MHSRLNWYVKNYTLSSLQERCPPGTQLATVVRMDRGIVQLAGSAGMQSGTDRPTNQCMLEQTLEEWREEWTWYHLELAEGGDLSWLADSFSNGTALFICDGSFQPDLCREVGDAAWII